jgi:hypothetical protein
MSLDHLRLGCPARIDAVERVEDEIGVIACQPAGCDDRIERAEICGGTKTSLLGLSARAIRGAASAARLAPAAWSRSRLRMTISSLSRHLGGANSDH